MGNAIGAMLNAARFGRPLLADFVGRLVHEGLQGVVKGDHEVGMMNRRLGSGEDGSERLVSVGQNIVVFVTFPDVENFCDVQIVWILVLFDEVLHESSLESDFLKTVLVGFLALEPSVGICNHSFVRGQCNVAHDDIPHPH